MRIPPPPYTVSKNSRSHVKKDLHPYSKLRRKEKKKEPISAPRGSRKYNDQQLDLKLSLLKSTDRSPTQPLHSSPPSLMHLHAHPRHSTARDRSSKLAILTHPLPCILLWCIREKAGKKKTSGSSPPMPCNPHLPSFSLPSPVFCGSL
jgi:hypothetical protein